MNSSLFGVRDGVVLRRAFDAIRLDAELPGPWKGLFVYGAPVAIGPGAFDDENVSGERLTAFELTRKMKHAAITGYVFRRRNERGVYLAASGEEKRTMVGGHAVARGGRWDGSIEGGYQFGSLAELDVSAWGMLIELGRRFGQDEMTRVGLNTGVASGDDDPDDRFLNSFDPLYPNLSVFSSAPLYFPTNQINVGIDVDHQLTSEFRLTGDIVAIARHDIDDAVYLVPGTPATRATSDSRFATALFEVGAAAQLNPFITMNAAYVYAEPLGDIKTDGGESAHYGRLQFTITF